MYCALLHVLLALGYFTSVSLAEEKNGLEDSMAAHVDPLRVGSGAWTSASHGYLENLNYLIDWLKPKYLGTICQA